MKHWFGLPLLIAFLAMQSQETGAKDMEGYAEIKFFGTSTLHDFDGTVRSKTFTVQIEGEEPAITGLEGATIEIPVKKMDTGKKKMNKNMYKMFDADKYPLITGTVASVNRTVDEQGKTESVQIDFNIKIRKIEKTITATVQSVRQTLDKTEVDVEMKVSCKAFKLEPPTMFGVLRVGDEVRVEATVILLEKGGNT